MDIGELLQRARKNKELTQEEVSKMLYVTRQTISRWEHNKTLPNIHVIKELSFLYDVPIDQLVSISKENTIYKEEDIEMKRINYMALFGSLVFNAFLFSGIAITLIILILSLWLIVGAFLISPFVLFYINLKGIQEFNWLNTILAVLLFPIGIILINYSKQLTLNLINFFKRYFKFNMKSIYILDSREDK